MLEAIQYYCSEVGIVADIQFGDVSSALAAWSISGGTDGGVIANGTGNAAFDPYASLGLMVTSLLPWCYIDDDTFQQKAAAAIYCSDKALQAQLYADVQHYLFDEVLGIPFASSVSSVGYRTDVFTRAQMDANILSNNYYNLFELSKASSW